MKCFDESGGYTCRKVASKIYLGYSATHAGARFQDLNINRKYILCITREDCKTEFVSTCR